MRVDSYILAISTTRSKLSVFSWPHLFKNIFKGDLFLTSLSRAFVLVVLVFIETIALFLMYSYVIESGSIYLNYLIIATNATGINRFVGDYQRGAARLGLPGVCFAESRRKLVNSAKVVLGRLVESTSDVKSTVEHKTPLPLTLCVCRMYKLAQRSQPAGREVGMVTRIRTHHSPWQSLAKGIVG